MTKADIADMMHPTTGLFREDSDAMTESGLQDDTFKPRQFVIPDIHGCYSTFMALLGQIALTRQDELYILGDYIDRGRDSRNVIERIIALQSQGYRIRPIMGNHELMLLNAISSNSVEDNDQWMLSGGGATLDSYHVDHPGKIDQKHIDFLASLPLFITTKTHVFVHAALDLTLEDPFSSKGYDSMLWDRKCVGDFKKLEGKKIVAGHTPRNLDSIRSGLNTPFIQIDNGCFRGNRFSGMGNLVALELNSQKLFIQRHAPRDINRRLLT